MAISNPFKDLSKPQLYAAIGGSVFIGGIIVVKRHKTTGSWNPFSKAPVTAASGQTVNPVTGLPYTQDNAIDPITGQTYLAEAEQYGSVATAESSVSAFGQSTASGSGIPVNPASPASSGSINTPVGTNVYTSNAAWAQAATAGLVSVGYDGVTVANALGAFLTQTPVTGAQASIIKTAIAEYGPAPIGNLQIILAPDTGPGQHPPVAPPTVSSGHVVSVTKSSGTVAWSSNNGVKFVCTLTGPGAQNGAIKTVTSPTVTFTGLEASHNYSVQILPYNSSNTAGLTGHIDFQTLKV